MTDDTPIVNSEPVVDVAALRKVVDYTLSLPEDTALRANSLTDGTTQGVWAQHQWFEPYAIGHTPPTDDDGHFTVVLTEAGVLTMDGKPCGTAACIAGWTAVLLAPNGTRITGDTINLPDGRHMEIDDWAAERLGLTEEQADELFEAYNDADDIRAITERIARGDTFTPEGYAPEGE